MTDHPSDPNWHPQVFPTARARHLAELVGLPLPPTNFEPYELWVRAAAAHLHGALDTARDELERDRDFLTEEDGLMTHCSPEGATRQECIDEAVRRFLAHLNELQEG